SSFSSESCPKKEAEEVEAEQDEINEVSSVSAKTKPSRSIRDESSESERCSTQGTPHSRASDRNSKRKTLLMKYEMEDDAEEECIEATTEVSYCPNAKETSEDENAEKKNVEEAENEANDEVEKETAEGTAINEETEDGSGGSEESTAGARDCTLAAQKTAELKSAGHLENVETGTELTEGEEQSKEEEQSSRPSTACSKSKGEAKAQSTKEDSLIQEAEENKEDQCSNCENGQEEGGENENKENSKLTENGEQEDEAVNDELPKENLEEEADQLPTNDDTNVNDADCGTELKADLEEQLGKESPNDPEPKNDEKPTSDDPDKAHEKYEDKGNNKVSERPSRAKGKQNRKRLKSLNKAAVFSCYSSVGNFSQQSQKGSEDEGEEECKDDNNPMSSHPNGEVQSDESSKPSQMYPDCEEEEEDKESSCTDPSGDEDQADAEGVNPKEVEHSDEVQASKKKEDSDEIGQDDLD
ncbi:hypothetical protein N329_13036, partial [Haliaeetus albicilla]